LIPTTVINNLAEHRKFLIISHSNEKIRTFKKGNGVVKSDYFIKDGNKRVSIFVKTTSSTRYIANEEQNRSGAFL